MLRISIVPRGLVPLLLALVPAGSVAQAPPEGLWNGLILLEPHAVEVEFTLELARTSSGRWVGSYDQPDLGLRWEPFERIEVESDHLHLELVRLVPEAALRILHVWDGTLSAGGRTVEGTVTEGEGGPVPFVMRWRGPPGTEPAPPQPAPVTDLSADLSELRTAFERSAGSPRLLLLVSPECSACLAGVGVVRRYVFEAIADPSLRVFVVWGPMLGFETRESVASATTSLADPRARHFWTSSSLPASLLERVLGLPPGTTAWDTYSLFSQGARWRESPPDPVLWMHLRRGLPEERRLNGKALAREVRRLLAGPS